MVRRNYVRTVRQGSGTMPLDLEEGLRPSRVNPAEGGVLHSLRSLRPYG